MPGIRVRQGRSWQGPHTWSNISKSLALGWWMVQMMERPPWASPFIRETTWKQDALSRPLQVKGTMRRLGDPQTTPTFTVHWVVRVPARATVSAHLREGERASLLCDPEIEGGKDGTSRAHASPV